MTLGGTFSTRTGTISCLRFTSRNASIRKFPSSGTTSAGKAAYVDLKPYLEVKTPQSWPLLLIRRDLGYPELVCLEAGHGLSG